MKYLGFLALVLCASSFAATAPASVVMAPSNGTTPSTCTITIVVNDTTAAVAAAKAAKAATIAANAVPNAVQKDPQLAANIAYIAALKAGNYGLIEAQATLGALPTDADVDAATVTQKAALDAQAVALKALRATFTSDPTR